MSLYTIIYLAPVDANWVAPIGVIRSIAELLQVSSIEIFSVSRETTDNFDPDDDDEEDRYEDILCRYNVPIDDSLAEHRAGDGYRTHIMFPFGDFMKSLADEIREAIPDAISGGYIPWDTSIHNGKWWTISYETGTISNAGSFAFCLHGSGCPNGVDAYLEAFLAVEGVKKLRANLESLTQQSFRALIELS